MAISLTLTFDDIWAARLGPMVVQRVDEAQHNQIIVALLDSLGITLDDLTVRQKAKLWILLRLLGDLSKFEAQEAARLAGDAVVDDIADNFPLEVGDA